MLRFKNFFVRHSDQADNEINHWLQKEGVKNIVSWYFKFAFDKYNLPAMLYSFLYEDGKDGSEATPPAQKRAKD